MNDDILKMRSYKYILAFFFLACFYYVNGQTKIVRDSLVMQFENPPKSARPWVFWYWMKAAVSKEGIAADIQAMHDANIGGAYLMPIKGATNPSLYTPEASQLSPHWWELVRFAMEEAHKKGIEIAMHDCDGFALAGGPWITPEMSMQKITWSKTIIHGGNVFNDTLPIPPNYKGYYKDVALFAIPVTDNGIQTSEQTHPIVRSNIDTADISFLAEKDNTKSFSSKEPCWIQYTFNKPFTCRSVVIKTNSNNYQAHRLIVESSDDGRNFRHVTRLEPARHGWQDTDADYTYAIPEVSARYFRLVYDPEGSEPGAEDLDAAKWKPSLKISGVVFSSSQVIDQYEGKSGAVWRVSSKTTPKQVPDSLVVPIDKIVNLTSLLDKNGKLYWQVPTGAWMIVRMGHTSTGHTNATGGAGSGLECDKFDSSIVAFQYQHWYGEIIKHIGPELSNSVLKGFHVDSWECGSQNWSPVFAAEFKRRRGYDPIAMLPVMAGIPIGSVEQSERFLYDIRQTIAALVQERFFKTMARLAHKDGKMFSAESVAPTMVSDGIQHYADVDIPMGEFWLRSPTHDKPNDMFDAISGARIYGKQIVQGEGFTELRMNWDEYPGMLKQLLDRNYALGMNRLVFHVFAHNPWVDKKPGMTLDGIGLYFQRDQTWWHQARGLTDYIARCQSLLQMGKPVVDIAVFTGEELPSRSILPDRLLASVPGLFGEAQVVAEKLRKENKGLPMLTLPKGVTASAHIMDWSKWVDPLRGYSYDAINKDALLRLAQVENGRIVLPGGASYKVLILPNNNPLDPNGNYISPQLASKIQQLIAAGATILMDEKKVIVDIFRQKVYNKDVVSIVKPKSNALRLPYMDSTLDEFGLQRDLIVSDKDNKHIIPTISFTHRKMNDGEFYFLSNQDTIAQSLSVSCRVAKGVPEFWDAVSGRIMPIQNWKRASGRTILPVQLEKNGSVFIVFRNESSLTKKTAIPGKLDTVYNIDGAWQLQFKKEFGGPAKTVVYPTLKSWSLDRDSAIRFYSGEVTYRKVFTTNIKTKFNSPIWLDMGTVSNIAHIMVNGIDCGFAWTYPYRVDISNALKKGKNVLEIIVANTWHNRILLDQQLPESLRLTYSTSPIQLNGEPLLESGLIGPVQIIMEK
ncbi:MULTISPECIES: glycosyl hydrolase [Chitinophagaceae]